jgi:hypothetical protein
MKKLADRLEEPLSGQRRILIEGLKTIAIKQNMSDRQF